MSKAIEVTLGGVAYKIPMLNIGQLERVSEVFTGPATRAPFGVLKIALERADPKPPKPDDIEAARDEIAKAVDQIMVLSGFKAADPNPEAPVIPGQNES